MSKPKTVPSRAAGSLDWLIGRRIRQRRIEKGLSQERLAEALAISFQQIQKYENGHNRISAARLYALAGLLEVPLTYFFENQGAVARLWVDGREVRVTPGLRKAVKEPTGTT